MPYPPVCPHLGVVVGRRVRVVHQQLHLQPLELLLLILQLGTTIIVGCNRG